VKDVGDLVFRRGLSLKKQQASESGHAVSFQAKVVLNEFFCLEAACSPKVNGLETASKADKNGF
jgi:hypothetical protein